MDSPNGRVRGHPPPSAKAAQTNLLISTAHGYQANLLLISRGEAAGTQPDVDFMMRYRPAGRFVIEPSAPTVSVAQTVALPTSDRIVEPPGILSPTTPPKTGTPPGANRTTFEPASFDAGRIGAEADTGGPVGIRSTGCLVAGRRSCSGTSSAAWNSQLQRDEHRCPERN